MADVIALCAWGRNTYGADIMSPADRENATRRVVFACLDELRDTPFILPVPATILDPIYHS